MLDYNELLNWEDALVVQERFHPMKDTGTKRSTHKKVRTRPQHRNITEETNETFN